MSRPRDHFVQRALLEPWSSKTKAGTRDNFVTVYDFDDKRLFREHASKVFAREGLNDRATELRVNQLIEAPLAELRRKEIRRRLNPELGPVKMDAIKAYRSAALLLVCQPLRAQDGTDAEGKQGSRLAAMINRPDAELSAVVAAVLGKYNFSTAVTDPGRMFYPQFGIFSVPVTQQDGSLAFVAAVPLDLNLVVLAAPRGATITWDEPMCKKVSAFSIGSSSSRQVVVPCGPEGVHHADEIGAGLEAMRAQVDVVWKAMHVRNKLAGL